MWNLLKFFTSIFSFTLTHLWSTNTNAFCDIDHWFPLKHTKCGSFAKLKVFCRAYIETECRRENLHRWWEKRETNAVLINLKPLIAVRRIRSEHCFCFLMFYKLQWTFDSLLQSEWLQVSVCVCVFVSMCVWYFGLRLQSDQDTCCWTPQNKFSCIIFLCYFGFRFGFMGVNIATLSNDHCDHGTEERQR